jgi:hypothetical protein
MKLVTNPPRSLRVVLAASAGAALGLMANAHPAFAATGPPVCGEPAALAELLRERFGEELRVRAREAGGLRLEFYVAGTGAWTLVVTDAGRLRSCAVAVGTEWEERRPPPAPDPRI